MMNRRDMLATGLLGTLAPTGAGEMQNTGETILRDGLSRLDSSVDEFRGSVDQGLRGNSMNFGGVSIFFDVYDWHVRRQQQIQIARIADQRMAIQFMFTQLVLRWENAESYVGTAYDR